jgi:UDP-glucose:(heptosyl)LPS alpha-1,3-glucosyltransferase
MRILIISEYLDTDRGGAETSTSQFINALTRAGHDVAVVTRNADYRQDDVTTLEIQCGGRTPRFATAAARVVADQRADVVHAITPCIGAHVYQPRGGAYPETIARNVALRRSIFGKILKRMTSALHPRLQQLCRLEARLMRSSHRPHVIAISDYVARQFVEHYQLKTGDYTRVFNAVSPPSSGAAPAEFRRTVREELQIPADHMVALIVAHNFKLKGVDCWLAAHRQLAISGTGITTIVVGRGKAGAAQHAMGDGPLHHVHFLGAVDHISKYYYAADILAHPTHYDPCSRVVLEAMLHGLPTVTTIFNGASEAITDRVDGRIVSDPRDVRALAAAAADLLGPSYKTALMTQHDQLVEQLGMNRHAREVLAVYETIRGAT